jgi:hypothetical protein
MLLPRSGIGDFQGMRGSIRPMWGLPLLIYRIELHGTQFEGPITIVSPKEELNLRKRSSGGGEKTYLFTV